MDDLISRQAAIDAVSDCGICIQRIVDLPSAEPERTGRWIPQDHNKRHGNVTTCMYYCPVCSECGHTGDFSMNYCPNCGCRMMGGGA